MKKLYVIFVLLLIAKLTSCHSSIQAPAAWQELYTQFISEKIAGYESYYNSARFSFAYINDDDIPELIIDWGSTVAGGGVFTFSNDKLVVLELLSGGVKFLERESLFKNSGGKMGFYFDEIYCVQDGEFVRLHYGGWSYMCKDNCDWSHISENEEWPYECADQDHWTWIWDDDEVSHDEYKTRLNAVFDQDRAKSHYIECYGIDEIFDVINQWGIPESPTTTSSEPPITVKEPVNFDDYIDKSLIVIDKHELSLEEFDYIIYTIDRPNRFIYDYDYDYAVIVLEKGGEVLQVIYHDSQEFGAAHLAEPSKWIRELDANFDGKTDILFHLGHFGAQGLERYACFLRTDDAFMENQSFSEIPNPVVDAKNQVILGSSRDGAALYEYYMFKFTDGEFLNTERLFIGEIYDYDADDYVLSWIDEVFIDEEWQLREKITQNDFDDDCEEWFYALYEENKHWGLSSSRWRYMVKVQ